MNEPTWYVGAHPRVYGAGLVGDIALVDKLDSSPCIRGRSDTERKNADGRKIHPRVYGADTKSLKQIRRVGRQAVFAPASYDKISMYHFF